MLINIRIRTSHSSTPASQTPSRASSPPQTWATTPRITRNISLAKISSSFQCISVPTELGQLLHKTLMTATRRKEAVAKMNFPPYVIREDGFQRAAFASTSITSERPSSFLSRKRTSERGFEEVGHEWTTMPDWMRT